MGIYAVNGLGKIIPGPFDFSRPCPSTGYDSGWEPGYDSSLSLFKSEDEENEWWLSQYKPGKFKETESYCRSVGGKIDGDGNCYAELNYHLIGSGRSRTGYDSRLQGVGLSPDGVGLSPEEIKAQTRSLEKGLHDFCCAVGGEIKTEYFSDDEIRSFCSDRPRCTIGSMVDPNPHPFGSVDFYSDYEMEKRRRVKRRYCSKAIPAIASKRAIEKELLPQLDLFEDQVTTGQEVFEPGGKFDFSDFDFSNFGQESEICDMSGNCYDIATPSFTMKEDPRRDECRRKGGSWTHIGKGGYDCRYPGQGRLESEQAFRARVSPNGWPINVMMPSVPGQTLDPKKIRNQKILLLSAAAIGAGLLFLSRRGF